ncbi:hypothetical protein C8F01DRAFT_1253302 [Mycena amicta]|nr:hypothetical protein C8F01DRAFT_1253302 [Mycena amicta]
MSNDSTACRHLNYQSHHIHLRPVLRHPDGTTTLSDTLRIRHAGVASTVDHSTVTSKETWIDIYNAVIARYNASLLGQRTGWLDLRMLCRRLHGMCGDHANNEKALSDTFKELKHDNLLQELGKECYDELSKNMDELQALTRKWVIRKIDDAGGLPGWFALSAEERGVRDVATYNGMIKELGEEALAKLDEADRQLLTLWVWTGCCMHKDQNSFKGGNTYMNAYWKELDIPGPILLANKQTAAAVRRVLHPEDGDKPASDDDLLQAQAAAFGGAKTAALAGNIFNNPMDKRGQGNIHKLFMEQELGAPIKRFVQTSKTWFGSFGDASCDLMERREEYIHFLNAIALLKARPGFTNIEKNVKDTLEDPPTLTKLAVMAIYHLFVATPYMRRVRAPKDVALNAISLGPLHAEILAHCHIHLFGFRDHRKSFAIHKIAQVCVVHCTGAYLRQQEV